MARKKLNYQNGTYFAVPLENGGFAMGVVARNDRKGLVFGYFFGPRLSAPEKANLANAVPSRAIGITKFGGLGFLKGEWTVLGILPNWKPSDWPMPPLARLTEPGHRAYLSYYDEDSFNCLREVEIDPETVSNYVKDGTHGYVSAQIWLTKLLS